MVSTKYPAKKILVVDDDKDTVLTYETGLRLYGFQVYGFTNPFKALDNFSPNFYDLLLIDLRMPEMTGFEFFNEIKKRDANAKVCFITSFEVYYKHIKEIYPEFKEYCFVQKPISVEMLAAILNRQFENT